MQDMRGLRLRQLELGGWRLTDTGVENLRGMPLTCLSARNCQLSDVGLRHLVGAPLTSLNLGFCPRLTDAALDVLGGLPLARLNVSGCDRMSGQGRSRVAELQAAWDSAYRCRRGMSSKIAPGVQISTPPPPLSPTQRPTETHSNP